MKHFASYRALFHARQSIAKTSAHEKITKAYLTSVNFRMNE